MIYYVVLCLLLAGPVGVHAEGKRKVVTTLSSYADIVGMIGGELVEVSSIASPKFDPHFIEPRPSHILKLKRADLFVHSGLDLEAWRSPLVNAAARSDIRPGGQRQLDLSLRIPILNVPTQRLSRAEGDIHVFGNPHYWLDPRNGLIIAEEIAMKLSELDPGHASLYEANLGKFKARLEAKMSEWKERMAPFSGTQVVGYHDGWVYLMDFTGLQMKKFLEPKPGIAPTPRQIQDIISYVRKENVPALIQSSHQSTDAAEAVADKTSAKVVILSQNVGDEEQSRDYISMFDFDIQQLLGALRHE